MIVEKWVELPFTVKMETVAQALKMDEDEDMLEEFSELFDKCMAIANPKILIGKENVKTIGDRETEVGGHILKSRVMRVNFDKVTECYPYVCTCGRELYEMSLQEGDPLTRFMIDAIAERVLGSAMADAMNRFKKQYGENYYAMNPGSLADFPLINQKPLFAMLGDVYGEIGVELTDSCLMLPAKSVSGMLFHSEEHYVNCAFCPREECPNRRAKFDEKLFMEKYGL